MALAKRHRGFSLIEVLIAVGTLAVGLTFIGGTFLAGIHLNTVATERTIAAVVANEAFAKVRLYGLDAADPNLGADHLVSFEALSHTLAVPTGADPNWIDPNEFSYPSARTDLLEDKQYFWSVLCRRAWADPSRLIQVTVFVSRKVLRSGGYVDGALWPVPVEVPVSVVSGNGNENRLQIDDASQRLYIGEGATIVNGQTGRIHRVLDSDPVDPDVIILDTNWQGGGAARSSVWVVPPPPSGGRKPCIAVYQKLIRF